MKKIFILLIYSLYGITCAYSQVSPIYKLSLFERAICCVKYFEGWHTVKNYPYIGYGHRIQPGETFDLPLTHRQADSLLRSDLHRLCHMFKHYGKDSVLLAVLAYNVGYGKVVGNITRPKSRLLLKIEKGDRSLYYDYISFCYCKKQIVPSIKKRRKVEFMLLSQ